MLVSHLKGCGCLWVTDEIWKLTFPHCLYHMEVVMHAHVLLACIIIIMQWTNHNFTEHRLRIEYQHTCQMYTNSPVRNNACCEEHSSLIEKNTPDIPMDLRKFIKHIGALKDGKKFWLKKSIEPYLYWQYRDSTSYRQEYNIWQCRGCCCTTSCFLHSGYGCHAAARW